jgi:hypothetical protein
MALSIGNTGSGMTKAIYDQVVAELEPDLGSMSEADRAKVRAGWAKLAHAVATGVVNHLVGNLQLTGVQTRGSISATVSGATATQSNVTFNQVAGTGTFS